MENSILKKVLQLGIVVSDAKNAAEQFCQLFEISQSDIEYFDMKQSSVPVKFRGEPVEAYNVIAMVKIAGIEFEFIQYVDGAPNSQKEFFDNCGAGIQHICIAVDNYEQTVDKMQHMGATTLVEGKDGKIGYKYMDMKDQMGLVFELYNAHLSKIKGV